MFSFYLYQQFAHAYSPPPFYLIVSQIVLRNRYNRELSLSMNNIRRRIDRNLDVGLFTW